MPALAAIWGSSFLLIKIGERAFAALQVSFGRMLIGTVTLIAVIAVRRHTLPGGSGLLRRGLSVRA